MASAVNYCVSPSSLTSVPELICCGYGDDSGTSSPSLVSLFDDVIPIYESSSVQTTSSTFDRQTACTHLTAAQHGEDSGRQKRPNTTLDKEANSRRTRRRAQNRASQRAFRERKEKHVQQLEHQLAQLDSRYRFLDQSYSDLVLSHRRLQEQVAKLLNERVETGLELMKEQKRPLDRMELNLFAC